MFEQTALLVAFIAGMLAGGAGLYWALLYQRKIIQSQELFTEQLISQYRNTGQPVPTGRLPTNVSRVLSDEDMAELEEAGLN